MFDKLNVFIHVLHLACVISETLTTVMIKRLLNFFEIEVVKKKTLELKHRKKRLHRMFRINNK